MPSKSVTIYKITAKVLVLSVLLGCLPINACLALGLPLISSNKKAALQVFGYEKLTTGAGPTTNDVAAVPLAVPNGPVNKDGSSVPSDLRPLTLHDEENIDQAKSESGTADDGVLKSTVSTTNYVPKEGDDRETKARSIKDGLDAKSLVKQAGNVGLGPVQLVETDEETNKKVDTILTAEQVELNDLWEATLARSPDIQFIVQKLQPTSNQAHLSTILTRMLSTVAFGGLGAAMMASPNMGMYAATSAGGSMLQQAIGMKERSDAKRAKLSQEEELVMFKMVRDTCDKLVSCFRDYKKNSGSLERANCDLVDLKAMVSEAQGGQDGAKQLEMEYTLRKQQRDIFALAEDVRRDRQGLVDLAGSEAVEKLDKQFVDERNQVQQAAVVGDETKQSASVNDPVDPQKTEAAAKPDLKSKPIDQDDKSQAGNEVSKQTASTNHSPES